MGNVWFVAENFGGILVDVGILLQCGHTCFKAHRVRLKRMLIRNGGYCYGAGFKD
jgi:hypothetical protein